MNYIIVEVNDGGAEATDSDWDGVVSYLSDESWKEARHKFEHLAWSPGMWMEFPCGWIFCVKGDAS